MTTTTTLLLPTSTNPSVGVSVDVQVGDIIGFREHSSYTVALNRHIDATVTKITERSIFADENGLGFRISRDPSDLRRRRVYFVRSAKDEALRVQELRVQVREQQAASRDRSAKEQAALRRKVARTKALNRLAELHADEFKRLEAEVLANLEDEA